MFIEKDGQIEVKLKSMLVTTLNYSDCNAFRYRSDSLEMQSYDSDIYTSWLLFENITLSLFFSGRFSSKWILFSLNAMSLPIQIAKSGNER